MTIQQILKDPDCPSSNSVSKGVKADIRITRDALYNLMVADPIRAHELGPDKRCAFHVLFALSSWLKDRKHVSRLVNN